MTNIRYWKICACVHVYVRKCGVICGSLTLICSKSLSFSTRTLKLTILSRAVLALRIESSLVEGSHWPQRSTKLLNTAVYIVKTKKNLINKGFWGSLPERWTAVDKSDGFSDVTVFIYLTAVYEHLMEHLHLSLKTAAETMHLRMECS